MDETTARLTALARETRDALHGAAGRIDPALRSAIEKHVAGEKTELDPNIAALVDQVRTDPVNADLQGLLDAGFSDDDVFEIVLIAATAEGMLRLDAGLAAMGGGAA